MHNPIVGHEGMELLTCKGRAVVSNYYTSMWDLPRLAPVTYSSYWHLLLGLTQIKDVPLVSVVKRSSS